MPGIIDLLDTDVENSSHFIDENSLISSVSEDTSSLAATKAVATKKPRKRKCVTIPKKPRAKNATSEPKVAATATRAKRKIADVEVKEDEEEDDLVEIAPSKPKGRAAKVAKPKNADRVPPTTMKTKSSKDLETTEERQDDDEQIPSPAAARSNFASTKTAKSAPRPIKDPKTKVTAKRQARPAAKSREADVSDPEEEDPDEELTQQMPPRKRMRQEPTHRRRAGSTSETERADPMLRRRLGDITRKYENMDIKYRNLKEVAVTEANANAERLRKQCEAITDASNKLVTSLKKELAQQAPLIQESRKLKKQAEIQGADLQKLRTANEELSKTLVTAQNEVKSLQNRLASARATSAPADVKLSNNGAKSVVPNRPGLAVNSQNEKEAALKLDLYADLTGLIIRSVQQTTDGDTYDCIQTGRNGTLHFKLFVDQENTKGVGSQESVYLYTPMLNADRDRGLIEVMPDYLTEDITFEREVAAKFYARVVKTLTEKPAEEEME